MKCVLVLHNLGFAHLDIKPDNFIVNEDLTVSFIDFGFTSPLSEVMKKSVGTKLYLAPEISHHRAYVAGAADIFSLGKTIDIMMKTCSDPSEYNPLKSEFEFLVKAMT